MNWADLFTLAGIQILAMASPGPDFALIIRHSLTLSRTKGLVTALGIAAGIAVHTVYILFGLGHFMVEYPIIVDIVKVVGGFYLAYLGIQAIRESFHAELKIRQSSEKTGKECFNQGFVTNLLNAKAILFYISVFTVIIDPGTPQWVMNVYGGTIIFLTLFFFSMLAWVFSYKPVQTWFKSYIAWIERITGAFLILIALQLFLSFL